MFLTGVATARNSGFGEGSEGLEARTADLEIGARAERLGLNGLHGEQCQVVDEAGFLLHEWFTVADAGEQAVMARLGEGALANFFFWDEERAAGRLVGILRLVGHQRCVALLDKGRDVDDEGGAHIGVETGVDDFEGTMRRRGCFHFGQAGEEAGFITERGDDGVIGVAGLPVGENDYAGAEKAENADDLETVGEGILDSAIWQVERLTPGDAENAGSFGGFTGAVICSASGSRFPLGEVEDGGAEVARGHAQQGSSAGLFHVVAMCGDGEYVDGGGGGHGRWREGKLANCFRKS